MNLTALSLYHGRDVARPVPTNADRLAAFRALIPPPLANGFFRFVAGNSSGPRSTR